MKCYICGKTYYNFWDHLKSCDYQEYLKITNYIEQLFFDADFNNQTSKDYLPNYDFRTIRSYYKSVFGKYEDERESKIRGYDIKIGQIMNERNISRKEASHFVKKPIITGKKLKEYTFTPVQKSTIDAKTVPYCSINNSRKNWKISLNWEELLKLNKPYILKELDVHDNYCPICDNYYDPHKERSFFEHLKFTRYEQKHCEALENQIQIAKAIFYEKDQVKALTLEKYLYARKELLWKNLFGKNKMKQQKSQYSYCPLQDFSYKRKAINLFHNLFFNQLSDFNEYHLPNFTYQYILNLWKKHYSKHDYEDRLSFEKLMLYFQKSNSLLISYKLAKENMKFANNYRCYICDKKLTDDTWVNHYKNKHYDFYKQQIFIATQLFDNFNLDNFIINQYGMKCNMFILNEWWKHIFGQNAIELRNDFVEQYQKSLDEFGDASPLKFKWEFLKNISQKQSKQCHGKIIKKSSTLITTYKLCSGKRIPRVDIPNNDGFRSTWEANVARIFILKNKKFDTEIPFEIPNTKNNISGHRHYYVDFIDYDNCFGYGNNTYIEVKGKYNDDAKEKEMLFKQTYPDKKLIFIGISNNDFHPEINYQDLEQFYSNKIEYWESANNNIYKNPLYFLPPEYKDKISLDNYQPQLELLPENTYNHQGITTTDNYQLAGISLSLQGKSNNNVSISGIRYDLGLYCNSHWCANICRIFKLKNAQYKMNVPFLLNDNGKEFIFVVSFIDIDNVFNFGKNTCIILIGQKTDKVIYKLNIFKKNFPDKKIITIGINYRNIGFDIDYNKLEGEYFDQILLWETKRFNLIDTPEFFTQELIPSLLNRVKERKAIYKKCPHCGKLYIRSFKSHLKYHDPEIYNSIL